MQPGERVRVRLKFAAPGGLALADARRALEGYAAAQRVGGTLALVPCGAPLALAQREDLAWLGLTWEEEAPGQAAAQTGDANGMIAALRAEGFLPEVVAALLPRTLDRALLMATNRQALRSMPLEQTAALLRPRLVVSFGAWERASGTCLEPMAWYGLLVEATRAEASTLGEMEALCAFALADARPALSAEAAQALADPWATAVLARCLETLTVEDLQSPEQAAEFLRSLRHDMRDTRSLRGIQVMHPVRAALAGSLAGPCLGIVAALLGFARCTQRIAATIP